MFRTAREVARVLSLPCREHTVLISRNLDEPLSRPARWALRMHFLVCSPCRRFAGQLRFLRAVGRRLRGGPGEVSVLPARMPEDVRARLRAKIGASG